MSVSEKIKKLFLSLSTAFLSLILCLNVLSAPVFAEPNTAQNNTTTSEQSQGTQNQDEQKQNSEKTDDQKDEESTNTCYDEAGSLGWLVCPTTGFLARITDGLYDVIQGMLVIKPLTSDRDSSFHQVWSIFRDITNVIFVIFFLVVIFSQVSGIGISNYGIKKLLPKIIVSAILINLSYIICAALVDVSNIAGASLKNVFTDIESNITATGIVASAEGTTISLTSIVSGLIGGTLIGAFAVGATGGFGALFISLLPILLGAALAVGIAYLTIVARQALVYLLIMISPLAFVCNLLPNTEKWFDKWKQSLLQMLFFYPMFATLFGACSLVGWTIIATAEEPFVLIMGIAVKIIPLFASWSLLKMSGTLPGQINSALDKAIRQPLIKSTSGIAAEQAALRRAKYLSEKPRAWQVGRHIGQNLQDRKYRTAADTAAYLEAAKNRGAAYASNYKNPRGKVSGRGKSMQALIEQNLRNKQLAAKNANDFEKGISSQIDPNSRQYQSILAQDLRNRDSADDFYTEAARGEMIARDNAELRHERFEAALTAHSQDALYHRQVDQAALQHYNRIKGIMGGDTEYTHYAGAYAANAHAVQDKIVDGKFMNYFDYIPATQEVVNRLKDLTNAHKSNEYIDSIVMGMKTLSLRGDTDLIKHTIDDILKDGQVQLGTHASQALANFCMFDVNGKDPFLRRYGKFINLETARAFNETSSGTPSRRNRVLSFNEYVTGEYQEFNEATGVWETKPVKRDSVVLLKGTSFDDIERTGYANMDESIRLAYADGVDENGKPTLSAEALKKMENRRHEIYNSILPAFVTASGKYPSGSEQIESQASWLTGYSTKDGKTFTKRNKDPNDPLFGISDAHLKQQTEEFVKALTSSQNLNLRTDFLVQLFHAFSEYREQELAESGELPEGWDTMSEEEKKGAKQELGYAKYRDLLDERGNLELIYMSKRSGAALASKPQLRDALKLNDQFYINTYLAKKIRERKQLLEETIQQLAEKGVTADDGVFSPVYENHDLFRAQVDRIFNGNGKVPKPDSFCKRCLKLLDESGLETIANMFKEYRNNNPDSTTHELYLELSEYLADPDNY